MRHTFQHEIGHKNCSKGQRDARYLWGAFDRETTGKWLAVIPRGPHGDWHREQIGEFDTPQEASRAAFYEWRRRASIHVWRSDCDIHLKAPIGLVFSCADFCVGFFHDDQHPLQNLQNLVPNPQRKRRYPDAHNEQDYRPHELSSPPFLSKLSERLNPASGRTAQ